MFHFRMMNKGRNTLITTDVTARVTSSLSTGFTLASLWTTPYPLTNFTNISIGTNSTFRPQPVGVSPAQFSEFIAWSVAYGMLAVMAVLGNSLVISVFACNVKLQIRTSCFIFGLAAADLFVGLFPIPMYIRIIFQQTGGNLKLSHLNSVYMALDTFGSFASIFQLTMIGLERYYAIAHPVAHRNTSKWLYLVTLAFFWFLSGTLSVVQVLSESEKVHSFAFLRLFLVCLSVVLIFFAYAGILIQARKRSKLKYRRRKKQNQELVIALAILMLLAVFMITWLPCFIISLIYYFSYSLAVEAIPPFAVRFTKLFYYSNSAINPIIYSLKVPGFMNTFRRLVRRYAFTRPPTARETMC